MLTTHKPAPKAPAKKTSLLLAKISRPTRAARIATVDAAPRFALIAMRLSAELKSLAQLGQTFSQVSYRKLGRINRIAGASQAVGAELASALSDGVLTQREIGSITRKAMAANGALAPKKPAPRR